MSGRSSAREVVVVVERAPCWEVAARAAAVLRRACVIRQAVARSAGLRARRRDVDLVVAR
jgi:hypothetical protein